MTLASAQRGYEYQDLVVALRLVDVMLGSIEQTHIDEELIPNDRSMTWPLWLQPIVEIEFKSSIQNRSALAAVTLH